MLRPRRECLAAGGLAGVVQWQNVSFPSSTRGFDSLHPLISLIIRYLQKYRFGLKLLS